MRLNRSGGMYLPQAGIFMKIPAVIFLLMLFSIPAKAADLYWIGGSGGWTDINHWSLSSGNKAGVRSPSIPQPGDNVFFDFNSGFSPSGKTIAINQEASCFNINVNADIAPILSGTILNLYGSASFQTGTVLDNILYCRGTGNSTIDFNRGVSGQSAIYFLGSGSYTLQGELKSSGKIYFLKGKLNFGASTVTTGFFDEAGCCGSVPFPANASRILDLGSAVITLTDRNAQSSTSSPSWAYTGATLSAGTSEINLAKGADDGYGVVFLGSRSHLYNRVNFTNSATPPLPFQLSPYQVDGAPGFKTLSFAGSGYITSSCTIGDLRLSPSHAYYISGILTIGGIHNPSGPCEKPWSINGVGSVGATINSTAPIYLIGAKLKSIKATGAGPFTVSGGIDGGDNSGWSFSTTGKNLYWIGGGGNWEDPSHWTTNENGVSSGGCFPTRNDNIFFNQYSGSISSSNPVVINSDDAECNNITWKSVPGRPVFKTALLNHLLNIFGSSEWQESMVYAIATTNYLGSKQDNTITSNGIKIDGRTIFLSSGKWSLADAFNSPDHDLQLKNGTLDTRSHTVSIKNFGSIGGSLGPRILTLGNSTVNVAGSWNYISFGGPSTKLEAETSRINLIGSGAYFYYESGLFYNDIAFESISGTVKLFSTYKSSASPALFNTITFASDAEINAGGNPTPIKVNNLSLAYSGKYTVGTNMELKVGKLKMNGSSCGNLLQIQSAAPGSTASLNLDAPSLIQNAKLSGINATGAALTVEDGIDEGNNHNIIFIPIKSRNFRWVNGSGKWSDPTHWLVIHDDSQLSSTACLPTSIDNVFFNAESGKNYTVQLDIPAQCNSMSWEPVEKSSPILKGLKENPLSINGSLTLQAGMDYDVERTNFTGNKAGNTITTNGVALDYSGINTPDKGVFFNGSGASWIISDKFTIKNFGLVNGSLNTNNQKIEAENYISEYAEGASLSVLTLGTSTVDISGFWDASLLKDLNAEHSTINLTGLMPETNFSGGGVNNNEFRPRANHVYNDVSFTNEKLLAKILGFSEESGAKFNNVNFAGEASISGSNQFNQLILGAGKNSHLMPGAVQKVNRLVNYSSCGDWTLDNSNSEKKAIIDCKSDVEFSHVKINGISVMGGYSYRAEGNDLGNNDGWIFSAPTPQNLYWIGGSGNWSDPRHWTIYADGNSSGGCLPTQFDNVFFTSVSGTSPVINIEGSAEFHDMTWSDVDGSPSIGGLLNCFGSLTLQQSLNHFGGINFISTDKECIIKTSGAILANNFDVSFSGSATYTLQDDLTTNSRIHFNRGTLNTNSKTITALSFAGYETASQNYASLTLNLGSSSIFLSDSEGWSYTGTHLSAEKSRISLIGSASRFKGNDGASYHSVIFNGSGRINKIIGSLRIDTLKLSANNNSYQFEAGKTITIGSELLMNGNNCSLINISSSVPGQRADLCVKKGDVKYNFIALQDIKASCLPLTVLPQSTDKGNNDNIYFFPANGQGIGILGPDINVCVKQLPVNLDGSSLMPNANTIIQWTNLTTGENLGSAINQVVTKSGNYRITAKYGENCEVSDDILVTVIPTPILLDKVTIEQPSCSSPSGSITIADQEGLSYSLDGHEYTTISHCEVLTGKHYLTARNLAGCVSDTLWIEINKQPLIPTAFITYGTTDFKAEGSVDIQLNGQRGGTFSASPAGLSIDPISGTIDLDNSTPDQFYTVSYTLASGNCSSTATTTVRINPSPAAISYPLMEYCAVGSVKIILTGNSNGTYRVAPAGLVLDKLTGVVNLKSSLSGLYTVIYSYRDGTKEREATTSIRVNALPAPSVTAPQKEIYKGKSTVLTAIGGERFAWIGPDIISGQNSSTITVRPTQTVTYTVIATNEEGCTSSSDIRITVKTDPVLSPNNIVTPNGDGKNDTWIIENIEEFPDNTVWIYDRAGRLIFTKKNYQNDWDATLNGKILNEDAYIFVIKPGSTDALIRGTLSIIRDMR